MKNENYEHCKSIALEIERIQEMSTYTCPECGEMIHWDDNQYNADEATYTCPHCGKTFEEHLLESFSLYDYFSDVYDIEYSIGGDKEYRSVRLMVACGGPNIYIDTGRKVVSLHWWTEHEEYPLSYDACNAIDEIFEEVYNC